MDGASLNAVRHRAAPGFDGVFGVPQPFELGSRGLGSNRARLDLNALILLG